MTLIENRWMLVPVLLLGASVVITTATVLSAVVGHPLGMEPFYDVKAASWDAEREQRAQNDRLRWVVTPELASEGAHRSLRLRVEDKHAARIPAEHVSVECIPVLRGESRRVVVLAAAPGETGVFEGSFDCGIGGQWEFRVTVDAANGRYTDTFRRQLPHARSATSAADATEATRG